VTMAMLVISIEAFTGISLGVGIFEHNTTDPTLLMLLFVSVTTATMLVFAAVAHERMSERRLRMEVSDAKLAAEIAQAEAIDANTRLRLSQEAAGASAWEYDVEAARIVRAFGEDETVDIMTGDKPVGGLSSELVEGDQEMALAAMRKAVNTQGAMDMTLRTGTADHPNRWLRVVGRYDGSNNRRRLVGMTLDVTMLHEAQAEVQAANDKLLSISRLSAMGAMASTLAHELNQPLTAIANYAATARMLLASNIPDANEMASEHLSQLVDASLRAGKIIRKMRDFTISGEITRTVADMADIVQSAWANVRDRPVAAGATLRFDVEAAAPLVAVDRLQIEQVLVNLLLNAVEATAGQEERIVDVTILDGEDAVTVTVGDNGCGLPDGMIDNLFEPFRTTKPDGTGLGLPICRTIVEAHGGKLWAANRADGGAELTFTIAGDALLH
jgi:C4-dicarboxylate-specific signal transduction histidine kinase